MFAFFDNASRSIGPSGVSMKKRACVTSSPSAFAEIPMKSPVRSRLTT
jgi:hypothetical protein